MDEVDEMRLIGARFRALVAEWDLTRTQVASLLGLNGDDLGFGLMPPASARDAERRLRMLLQIRDLLPGILPDRRDAPLWLRGAYGGDVPLVFMSLGAPHVRAVRDRLLAHGR